MISLRRFRLSEDEDYMAKIKVKSSFPKTQVSVRLYAQEVFLIAQCRVLNNNFIQGLMRLDGISGNTAIFSAPADMKLRDMLNRGIDRNSFFSIISQVINTLRWLNMQKYLESNLVFHIDYAFVNSATKELFLLYIPAGCEKPQGTLKSFMESLVFESSFVFGEDNGLKQELMNLLNSGKSVNLKSIEQYVMAHSPAIGYAISKPFGEEPNRISDTKSEFLRQMDKENPQIPEEKIKVRKGTDIFYGISGSLRNCPEFGTIALEDGVEKKPGTVVLEQMDGTTVLNESGTVVLDESVSNCPVQQPKLIRKRTGEEVLVDKPVFRIGKEEGSVDYLISDNPTVSRNHADIISRGGRYYLYDNNSTNRSYINNILAEPLRNIEIFDGTGIRLSDEEFEFRIMNY